MAKTSKRNNNRENWVDVDWSDPPRETGLDDTRAKKIGIWMGLIILVAGAAYFIANDNAKPRLQKKVRTQEEVVASGMRHFHVTARADTTRVATVWDFSRDILKLDKAVYSGVRFILDSGESISAMEQTDIDLAKVVIDVIEIDVRAKPWDALKSDDRTQLLYKTYRLLKGSYPEITRQVRLVFDDKRNLDFEFDKMFS